MTAYSPFRLDLFDANGDALGDGPIYTATTLNTKARLDGIGTAEFSIPAGDERSLLLTAGAQIDIYDEQDGFLGRYFFAGSNLDERAGTALLRVTCHDALIELTRRTVGFRRRYTNTDVGAVVNDLMTVVPDWIIEAELSLGNITVAFEGESVLAALTEVLTRFGLHYRLKLHSRRILQIGSFGEASGYKLLNLPGVIQPLFTDPYTAAVEGIGRVVDPEGVYNRIIGLGAGQGAGEITMAGATAGLYPLQSASNADGSLYYFVEDEDSVALYDRRDHVLKVEEHTPPSNSEMVQALTADAVKVTAEAFLLNHRDPRTQYTMTLQHLGMGLAVGDTARLSYRAARDGVVYLDVDEDLYVMEIQRQRSASGDSSVALVVSTVLERRTSDTDAIVSTMRAVQIMRTHVQPTVFLFQNRVSDVIEADNPDSEGLAKSKYAKTWLDVNNMMTGILQVRLNFRTRPLHTLDLYDGTLNTAYFEVRTGRHYPGGLRLFINGVERTSAYGGPWNPGGSDAAVDVTLDITADITGASGGLYQRHEIELRAAYEIGDNTLPSYTPVASASTVSNGWVDMELTVLGTAQALIAETI